jgi:hypothetical protein
MQAKNKHSTFNAHAEWEDVVKAWLSQDEQNLSEMAKAKMAASLSGIGMVKSTCQPFPRPSIVVTAVGMDIFAPADA